MKENNVDFDSFVLDKKIKSLPNVPVSQATKDRILTNVLQSKNKKNKNFFKNTLEILTPITLASAFIIMFLFLTTNYSIGPRSYYDGFYLRIAGNVEGAIVFLGDEQIGQIPMLEKVNRGGVLRISKEGYKDWVGNYSGDSLSSFIRTFNSSGQYQLYRGNNTVKIHVELEPINSNTITFYTELPGATILVNGRYAGLTPSPIRLSATHNIIEIIQPNKEKITLELLYDGRITFVRETDKTLEYTEKGYILRLQSQNLHYPINGKWLNEREYLVLDSDGTSFRGRLINLITNRVTIVSNEDIIDLLNQTEYKKEIQNSSLFNNNTDARLISIQEGLYFYQIDETLYSFNRKTEVITAIATNIMGEINHVEISQNGVHLTKDGKLYRYSNGVMIALAENLNSITHFSLLNNNILIFNLDKYVEIWYLEKESIRKIY